MDTTELLSAFGLTRTEAVLYTALFNLGESNGYELAKFTGISRSNIYTALTALCDKGAAYIVEGNSTCYVPVSLEEFCANKIRQLEKYGSVLADSLPSRREEPVGYITIKGHLNIINKMQNIIKSCRERIYISAPDVIINELLNDLTVLVSRGLKVVVITSLDFELDGAIVYKSKENNPQIRLIADTSSVLTGDSALTSDATCLYSQKHNLVELIRDTLKNEILLINLTLKPNS
ncbi:MAG: TrmB family transcriptional regulator [Eubacteriales bacterium]